MFNRYITDNYIMACSPNNSSTVNVSTLDAFITDSLNLMTLPEEIFDPKYLEDIASNSALLDESEHNIDIEEHEKTVNEPSSSESRDGQGVENSVDAEPARVDDNVASTSDIHSQCMEIILSQAEEFGLDSVLPNGIYNNMAINTNQTGAWTPRTSSDFLDFLTDVNQNCYYNSKQSETRNYFSDITIPISETLKDENINENVVMEINSRERNIEQIIETLLPSCRDSTSDGNDSTRNESQFKNSGGFDSRVLSPFGELHNLTSKLLDTNSIEVASMQSNANNIPCAIGMYGNNLTSVPDHENNPQLIDEEGGLNSLVSNPALMPTVKHIQEPLTNSTLSIEDIFSEDLTPYLNIDYRKDYLEDIDQVNGDVFCSTFPNENSIQIKIEYEETDLEGTAETPADAPASTSELCQNTTNKTLGSILHSVSPEFNKENIIRINKLLKIQRRETEENDGKRTLAAITPNKTKAITPITPKTPEQGSSEITPTKSSIKLVNTRLMNIPNKILESKSSPDRPIPIISNILRTERSSIVNANGKSYKDGQMSIARASTAESGCSRTTVLQPAVAKMCEVCGIRLKNKSAFLSHLQTHQISRRLACYICNKSFPLLKDLKKHLTVSHLQVVSSESIKINNSNLRQNKPKLFVCATCQASFMSPSHLNQHKIVHIQEKPFKCLKCDRVFGKPQFLAQHMKLCPKKW